MSLVGRQRADLNQILGDGTFESIAYQGFCGIEKSGSDDLLLLKMQEDKELYFDRNVKMVPLFVFVKKLGFGESFGETELLNSSRRTASCICGSEVYVLSVKKGAYK